MPIHDLGYRHWEGTRTPLKWRWLAIARTGIHLAWRSKLIMRFVWLAWVPTLYLGFFFFAVGQVTEDPMGLGFVAREAIRGLLGRQLATQLERDPAGTRQIVWKLAFYEFSRRMQLWPALVIAGLVGSGLLARDVQGKSFLLYYSRPITLLEYYLGKALVLVFYVALVTLLPNLALYACSIAFSPSLEVLGQTWMIPLFIIASFLTLVVPVTALVLFFSAMTRKPIYAGFAWFTTLVFGQTGSALLIGMTTFDVGHQERPLLVWPTLISFKEMIDTVIMNIYGVPTTLLFEELERPEITERPLTAAAVLLAAVAVVATVATWRRLSAPVRL